MLSHTHKGKNQFVFEEEIEIDPARNSINNMNDLNNLNNFNRQVKQNVKVQESLVDSLDGIENIKGMRKSEVTYTRSNFVKEDLIKKNTEGNNTAVEGHANNNSNLPSNIPAIIVIEVEEEEFQLETENNPSLVIHLESIYDPKTERYLLPKWVDKKHFEYFLNLLVIRSPTPSKLDLHMAKKIIDISVFLKTYFLIKNIISDSILPTLDRHTSLRILKDYIHLLYEEDTRGIVISLIQKSIEISADNIFYLINNHQDDLFSLSKDTLEEIIERYFESVQFNTNIDHSLIMRLMMKSRKVNDIYDLLENERKRSIAVFEKLYQDKLEPTIIWGMQIEDPSAGYYKESEEFVYENVSMVLINYYDADKDVYSMALRITDIKDTQSNSSIDIDTNQFIFSILSICEIREIHFKSKINFNCIFTNTKTKILVSKIENFSKYFSDADIGFNNLDYSLVIYFNTSYNFSAVLAHICRNFYEYHSLNSICRISRNVLNIILKNNSLNVRSEDEVLYAVINWINNKQSVTAETVQDIVKNINWTAISLDALLDFIISQSKLLINSGDLQTMVISEFSRRFKEEYGVGTNAGVDINSHGNSNTASNMTNSNNIGNNVSSNLSPRKKMTSNNLNSHTNSNSNTSFTSELITKLIKIASKYESPYLAKTNSINKSNSNQENSKNQIIPALKSVNPFKGDKIVNNSSRNTYFHCEDSKQPSMIQIMNTSPDASTKKGKSPMTPPCENEFENCPRDRSSLLFNGSSFNADHLRKTSASPLTNKPGAKIGTKSGTNVSENSLMKKKIFQCNMLAQSKDEKFSNLSKLSEINKEGSHVLYQSVNRQKTPNNRSLHRENSMNSVMKSKSRSINEKENRQSSNSASHTTQNPIQNNIQTKKMPNISSGKFKFSQIYTNFPGNKNNVNVNININSISSQSLSNNNMNSNISAEKKRKTPKSMSIPSNMTQHSQAIASTIELIQKGSRDGNNTRKDPVNKLPNNVYNGIFANHVIPNATVTPALAYVRPLTNTNKSKSKENLSSVKFIRKDLSRPKSASGTRPLSSNCNNYTTTANSSANFFKK